MRRLQLMFVLWLVVGLSWPIAVGGQPPPGSVPPDPGAVAPSGSISGGDAASKAIAAIKRAKNDKRNEAKAKAKVRIPRKKAKDKGDWVRVVMKNGSKKWVRRAKARIAKAPKKAAVSVEDQLRANTRTALRGLGLSQAEVQGEMAKLERMIVILKEKNHPIPTRPFLWRTPNRNPAKISAQAKAQALHLRADEQAVLSSNEYTMDTVRRGDLLGPMVFGQGKVASVVLAAFPKGTKVGVRKYQADETVLGLPPGEHGFCGNTFIDDKAKGPKEKPVVIYKLPEIVLPEREAPEECLSCTNAVEPNASIAYSMNGGDSTGLGSSADIMHWWNATNVFGGEEEEKECSRWNVGFGPFGSVNRFESESKTGAHGHGYKVGIQEGIKWYNVDPETQRYREWVLKTRQGFKWSKWENDYYHDSHEQSGFGVGFSTKYTHELVKDKFYVFAEASLWAGVGEQTVKASSKKIAKAIDPTYARVGVGAGYNITQRLSAEVFAGFDVEGWSGEIPFVPSAELIYSTDHYGEFGLGVECKIYSALNPASIITGRWSYYRPYKAKCIEKRQAAIKPAGVGIGGRNGNAAELVAQADQFDDSVTVSTVPASPFSTGGNNSDAGQVKASSTPSASLTVVPVGDHAGDATNVLGS